MKIYKKNKGSETTLFLIRTTSDRGDGQYRQEVNK